MTFNEYQENSYRAIQHHESHKDEVLNWMVGLSEETGEVANLIKHRYWGGEELDREKLIKEMGDVLWYLSAMASALEIDLNHVAKTNMHKLEKRHPGGTFSIANSINRKREK